MKKIENMNRVQKMTLSAMIMALYIVVLSVTSGFSFGAYQIRIATALYAMGYFFRSWLYLLVSPILYPICCSAALVSLTCWAAASWA